jgi:polysaccharide export outer membrane protein
MGGCSTTSHEDWAAFLKAHESKVAATETRIQPGDTIELTSHRVLEVDRQRRTVHPEGKISLDLVGEVSVVGLTPREIANKLRELLRPYYTEPDVRVRVVEQPRRVYYVLGQVAVPGPFPFTGHDTLLHTLAMARPNHIAWKSRVKVIRPNPVENWRHEIEVDVDTMVKTGDTRGNILLEPGDVVYVPPTPLGWLGLRVRELLFPFSPAVEMYSTPGKFMRVQEGYETGEYVTGSL